MGYRLLSLGLGVFLLLFASCGKSEEKLAQEMYVSIDSLYRNKEYAQCLNLIDTLNAKYEKQTDWRKKAKIIELNILVSQQECDRANADSVMPNLQKLFNNQLKAFTFEKDERYQTEGTYIYKGQETERIAGRTLLKPVVDEQGNITLHSMDIGTPIHTSIRVTSSNESVESEKVPQGSVFNHVYSDGDVKHQDMAVRVKAEDIVIFISDHAEQKQPIKVTLLCDERTVKNYFLSGSEINAISASLELSRNLKRIRETEYRIQVAEKKIANYQNSLGKVKSRLN